ncbi:MAG: hypothetical protein IPK07_31655 [Deltaproteobacteria bacterium]|nr:hypothetical protein [Deltaproteobacteria bacterium]
MRGAVNRGRARWLAEALAALIVLVIASGCAARAPRSVVDRVLDAYGAPDSGEPAAFEQVGRIVSPMHPGLVGTVVRKSAGPSRLRVETTFPGQGTEVRIVDGERGWRDGVEVAGPNLAAMQLQAARLALPGLLTERRAQLVDRGEVTSGVARRHVLEMDLGHERSLTLEIDPATGHIVRTIGRAGGAPGRLTIEFTTEYDELRAVDGRLFPFYECTTAMGRRTADITFTSAATVSAFPASTFAP